MQTTQGPYIGAKWSQACTGQQHKEAIMRVTLLFCSGKQGIRPWVSEGCEQIAVLRVRQSDQCGEDEVVDHIGATIALGSRMQCGGADPWWYCLDVVQLGNVSSG